MASAAIVKTGMVTGVGLNARATCAAIRVGITGFAETGFMFDGDWLIGSEVPLEGGPRGRDRFLQMATMAVAECVDGVETSVDQIPALLCLPETERPGRPAKIDGSLLEDIQAQLGLRFHPDSGFFTNGRVGGAQAMDHGRELIAKGAPACIVVGVDSMLIGNTLDAFHGGRRLQTAENSDGFIPGEAAAAVLLRPAGGGSEMLIQGIGFGSEPSPIESDEPLRADGLVEAFRAALEQAGRSLSDLDYRVTDIGGSYHAFRESALAFTRVMRDRRAEFDIWHHADCTGEVGAATVPLACGVALAAARKRYSPGPGVLCHFSNDDGQRAGVVLHFSNGVQG